jgi:multidrug transporter EmrE-like cation transporter
MNDNIYQLFLFTVILATVEIIAMTLVTNYAKNGNKTHFVLSCLLYAILPFIIVYALKFQGIGTVNFMWNIISTISMIIIGYYVFNDSVTNLHYISFMLGFSAIVVLYYAERTTST